MTKGFRLHRRQIVAGLLAAPFVRTGRAAAQSGNDLVVYSTVHPAIQERLTNGFTAQTGINVQSLRLNSAATAQRFIAEQQAGQYLCDVLTLTNDAFFDEISAAGMIADISDRPSLAALEDDWRPDPRYCLVTAAPAGIAYHRATVSSDSIPTGWEDVLKSEFRGQLILTDPRMNETIVQFLLILHDTYGPDFLRALGQQQPVLVPVTQQGVELLAAGEGKLVLPCNPGNLARYEGQDAPVALAAGIYPTFWTPFYTGIPTTASRPEEAGMWLDYVLSPEGQELLCRGVSVSALPDVPGSLPRPSGKIENPSSIRSQEMADTLFDLLGLPA